MNNNIPFPEVKNKLGFGAMRLKMNGDKVDYDEFCKMVDIFIDNGFNYFDTAHGYISGQSEIAIRECLAKRYPRESFLLADKLSEGFFKTEEEIIPLFESQLEACGVEYFDFYLMHAMCDKYYPKYVECKAFETLQKLKEEGKIRHIGMSFHDTADVLDKILSAHKEIEFVQIQFNYADYNDEKVQSGKCYDVCVRHNIPTIVMEPIKGGKLADLPSAPRYILESHGGSPASYALRYAASFPNNFMVLSGMGSVKMMEENIACLSGDYTITADESELLAQVNELMSPLGVIQCTKCSYCTEGCPKGIPIPEFFAYYNNKILYGTEDIEAMYDKISGTGKIEDCIKCGKCEHICPQHLPIRQLLEKI